MSSLDNYNFLNNWERRNNDYFSGTPVDYLQEQETSALPQPKEVEVSIIPKLKETNEISLSKGDTLVVYLPEEAMDSDVDELQAISDMFDKMFPNNQVLFLPNTFKLGVIKNV
jgi:hypothetical protein